MAPVVIAAVAAPIVAGVVGSIMSSGDRKAAKKAMKKAYAELAAVGMPPDLSRELIMKEFSSQGILTPELEEDLAMEESEFKNITEDSSVRDTQLEALNKFKQQADTGFGMEERAAFNQMQQQVRQDQRAKQQQILADQQRRGMAGSGNELVAQLLSSQAGADQASAQGNELAAMIAQRVRQGTQDMSGAAQNLRSQDYQVSSDRAQAIDARNQYLHQNSTARQARNVASTNEAAAANLANKQRISEMNTNLANQEKLRQSHEEGALFDRKMGLAQAKANARVGQAGSYQAAADRTAGQAAAIGAGVGQGISAYAKTQSGATAEDDQEDDYKYR